MIVTAWNNGSHSNTGAGYGLKLQIPDRDRYFNREWKSITIELTGSQKVIKVNVAKKSFWGNTCRELIHAEIGRWLLNDNLAPWPIRQPLKLKFEHIKDNHFRLKK